MVVLGGLLVLGGAFAVLRYAPGFTRRPSRDLPTPLVAGAMLVALGLAMFLEGLPATLYGLTRVEVATGLASAVLIVVGLYRAFFFEPLPLVRPARPDRATVLRAAAPPWLGPNGPPRG